MVSKRFRPGSVRWIDPGSRKEPWRGERGATGRGSYKPPIVDRRAGHGCSRSSWSAPVRGLLGSRAERRSRPPSSRARTTWRSGSASRNTKHTHGTPGSPGRSVASPAPSAVTPREAADARLQILPPAGEVSARRDDGGGRGRFSRTSPTGASRHLPRWGEDCSPRPFPIKGKGERTRGRFPRTALDFRSERKRTLAA